MGLSQSEHLSWARTQGHHADDISAQADPAVRSVVHYELTHDTQDIDEERRALARLWLALARTLQECEPQRFPEAPLATRLVVLRVADPMVRLLAADMNFPDMALGRDILGLSLSNIYRPSSTPGKLGCRRCGRMPSGLRNFDGTVWFLMSWCWRVFGSFPSRTMF